MDPDAEPRSLQRSFKIDRDGAGSGCLKNPPQLSSCEGLEPSTPRGKEILAAVNSSSAQHPFKSVVPRVVGAVAGVDGEMLSTLGETSRNKDRVTLAGFETRQELTVIHRTHVTSESWASRTPEFNSEGSEIQRSWMCANQALFFHADLDNVIRSANIGF